VLGTAAVGTAVAATEAAVAAASSDPIVVAGGDRLRGRVAAALREAGADVAEVTTMTPDELALGEARCGRWC